MKINPLDMECLIEEIDPLQGGFEAQELIEECFAYGFFPWDSPKFRELVCFEIEANISGSVVWGRQSLIRGWMYAQKAMDLLQGDPAMVELAARIRGIALEAQSLGTLSSETCCQSVVELVGYSQAAYDRSLIRNARIKAKALGIAKDSEPST